MKKNILFIILLYCVVQDVNAQFCNSQSVPCYQKDACLADSQIYTQDYKYATVHNVYKSATATIDLYMTIYSPCALPVNITNAKKAQSCKSCKRPFILLIHGGGFRAGCRKTFAAECEEFAKRGYITASIDYRLGWVPGDEKQTCKNSFCFDTVCAPQYNDSCNPAYKDSMNFALYRALQDAAAAMRFITHYADSLNIDRNYLYIGGHSAGAIVATNICYMDQHDLNMTIPAAQGILGTIKSSGNNFKDSFKIAGLYNNWGSIKDTAFINGDKDKIPMIAFHGIDDPIVPFAKGYPLGCTNEAYDYTFGSYAIYQKLITKYPDLPIELYTCYGGHGIFNANCKTDPKSLYRIQKAVCFFNRVRNGDKSRTYIRINQQQDDITYTELDSISPVNCSFTGLLNSANVYASSSLQKTTGKNFNEFVIYPNPASSHATLQVTGELKHMNITITDLSGRILWGKNNISAVAIDLPVQNLTNGLYFVIIKTDTYSRVLKLLKSN